MVLSTIYVGALQASENDGLKALTICENFGCKLTKEIYLSENQLAQIDAFFPDAINSPVQERIAIARAIGAFEKLVGAQSRTGEDKGGNIEGGGSHGQLDCIGESINTTTYLHAIEQRGLLKWHTPGERAYRRPYIFDQHWSATIKIKNSEQAFAVDSWFLHNGKQPYVQALADWQEKVRLPYNPDAAE